MRGKSDTIFYQDQTLLNGAYSSLKVLRVSVVNDLENSNSIRKSMTLKNYNQKTSYLEIEGISNTERILKDSYIYTSGLGGIFPSGILIGTVTDIKTDEYDLAKVIYATPIADFNDINYVAILKRKEKSE